MKRKLSENACTISEFVFVFIHFSCLLVFFCFSLASVLKKEKKKREVAGVKAKINFNILLYLFGPLLQNFFEAVFSICWGHSGLNSHVRILSLNMFFHSKTLSGNMYIFVYSTKKRKHARLEFNSLLSCRFEAQTFGFVILHKIKVWPKKFERLW